MAELGETAVVVVAAAKKKTKIGANLETVVDYRVIRAHCLAKLATNR